MLFELLLILMWLVIIFSSCLYLWKVSVGSFNDRHPTPCHFEFVGARILCPVTLESILIVRDTHLNEFKFRGSNSVWHHYPEGFRAGRLLPSDAILIEEVLETLWLAHVKWKGKFQSHESIDGEVVCDTQGAGKIQSLPVKPCRIFSY